MAVIVLWVAHVVSLGLLLVEIAAASPGLRGQVLVALQVVGEPAEWSIDGIEDQGIAQV